MKRQQISEEEKIERGKRLKECMEDLRLKEKDFVSNSKIPNPSGIVENSSVISLWVNGGQLRKNGKRTGFLQDNDIDLIVNDFFPKVRPDHPRIHADYIKCIDDCKYEKDYKAYFNKQIEEMTFNEESARFFTLPQHITDYIMTYLRINGFSKYFTTGEGKYIIEESETNSESHNILYPEKGKFDLIFYSKESGIYSIDLKEWWNMQQDISDYIRFQICKRIFKEDYTKFLSLDKVEARLFF